MAEVSFRAMTNFLVMISLKNLALFQLIFVLFKFAFTVAAENFYATKSFGYHLKILYCKN